MTWPDLIKQLLFEPMDPFRYWYTLAAILVTALLIGWSFALRPAFVRWLELHYRSRPRGKPRPAPAKDA